MFFASKKSLLRGTRKNRLDNKEMQRLVQFKPFCNAQLRAEQGGEAVQVGRRVQVGLPDGGRTVSVVADGQEVFRYPAKAVHVFPHMGGGGMDLVYQQGGEYRCVVLHHINVVRR